MLLCIHMYIKNTWYIYIYIIIIYIYLHSIYIYIHTVYTSIRIKREGKTDIKLPPFWNMKCNWMIFSGPSFKNVLRHPPRKALVAAIWWMFTTATRCMTRTNIWVSDDNSPTWKKCQTRGDFGVPPNSNQPLQWCRSCISTRIIPKKTYRHSIIHIYFFEDYDHRFILRSLQHTLKSSTTWGSWYPRSARAWRISPRSLAHFLQLGWSISLLFHHHSIAFWDN